MISLLYCYMDWLNVHRQTVGIGAGLGSVIYRKDGGTLYLFTYTSLYTHKERMKACTIVAFCRAWNCVLNRVRASLRHLHIHRNWSRPIVIMKVRNYLRC